MAVGIFRVGMLCGRASGMSGFNPVAGASLLAPHRLTRMAAAPMMATTREKRLVVPVAMAVLLSG